MTNPPTTPGEGYRFTPVGSIPTPDRAQIWDNRTGTWRPLPVVMDRVRPADSLIMPYGWYREPIKRRVRRIRNVSS